MTTTLRPPTVRLECEAHPAVNKYLDTYNVVKRVFRPRWLASHRSPPEAAKTYKRILLSREYFDPNGWLPLEAPQQPHIHTMLSREYFDPDGRAPIRSPPEAAYTYNVVKRVFRPKW